MENVSLLEDLGERQLKTEVRNGGNFRLWLQHHSIKGFFSFFFFKYYYYYYLKKEFYKPQSIRLGRFIFPSPRESESELSGKKKSSHAVTHRGILVGAAWTFRSMNQTTLLLLELCL